jgi:hypothetical protein
LLIAESEIICGICGSSQRRTVAAHVEAIDSRRREFRMGRELKAGDFIAPGITMTLKRKREGCSE